MTVRIALGIVLLLLSEMAFGQLRSPERNALKAIRKERWDKASVHLTKAIKKDSLHAGAKYIYALFYFKTANPSYNIDSASLYLTKAKNDFLRSTRKQRDRHKRIALDSSALVLTRKNIDNAAFERAKKINTEGAYLHFLQNFATAAQREQAIMLRDEAAYLDAVKSNNYESFLIFLEKYPGATQVSEARSTYERLLYEAETRDRTLTSYEDFILKYPATPYRREVEKNIFEIATASAQISAFINFLEKYPISSQAERARNILFHLLQESDEVFVHNSFMNDSLRHIKTLNEEYLIPILNDGKFGFINKSGQVVIEPTFLNLDNKYKCGNIEDDVLLIEKHLISRDGKIIISDSVEQADNIGFGFLKITSKTCISLIHKSGYRLSDCVDDAKVIAEKFIALRKANLWALITFSGRSVTLYDYEEITFINDLIILKRNDKYSIATASLVALVADNKPLKLADTFEEVKLWSNDKLWLRSGEFQGVLNQQMEPVIHFEKQDLKETFFGSTGQSAAGYKLFSHAGREIGAFKKIKVHAPWVVVQQDSSWMLFDIASQKILGSRFDSVYFAGPFAMGSGIDSLTIHFPSTLQQQSFPLEVLPTFIPGKDSTAFLMLQDGKKKTIYDHNGVKLFTAEYDNILYAGDGLFIVSKKDKKGLLSSNGKVLLPIEFDAIGSITNDVISLLKNRKFGAYHIVHKKLIKPQYEKNLAVYNPVLISAFQNGFFGFIDWDNKPHSKFEFSEIQYWNDTTALVKKNFGFMLYEIVHEKFIEETIENIAYILDTPDEKLGIIKQENSFGVLSSKRGFVVPATFTKIVNVGSAEDPVYFTEKHVEEASIYVVIYYDNKGRMLNRQVYEEDDYEEILCSDN